VNHPEKLRLNFVDEASNLQECWTLSLATRDAVDQLVTHCLIHEFNHLTIE